MCIFRKQPLDDESDFIDQGEDDLPTDTDNGNDPEADNIIADRG